MLLGLSLIIGGTDPLLVGLLPLFCLFTFTHINRDIESGHIARGQAELRSYIEVYEKTFNGTCFLSSPEQRAVVTMNYFRRRDGARVRPATPQPRVLQMLSLPRRRGDLRRPGRPTR